MTTSAVTSSRLLLCVFFVFSRQVGAFDCPPVRDEDGEVHVGRTLYACSARMTDPYQPVTHVKKYFEAGYTLDVEVKFTLNNLISVNELENTATIDFFYRQWWQDVRWNLTDEFWDEMPLSVYFDGIELYPLTHEADDPLPYWKPDLHFIDAIQVDEWAGLCKLRPGGKFYWSRHIVTTIMQPDFYLKDYPKDSQHVLMAIESYAYTQGVMSTTFYDPPISYVADIDGDIVFGKNPIWQHDKGSYTSAFYEGDYTDNPAFPRVFVVLVVNLLIERAGRGILVRFALPILILLLLSAATFWADPESRISTTMTILLSVSALYVVIIEGIPQVGYLTTFDSWIFLMYTALAMGVVLHQIVIVLKRKKDSVPLRGGVIRLIEFFGRVFTGPLSVLYYMLTFLDPSITLLFTFLTACFTFMFLVGAREWGGLKKSFMDAADGVKTKLDHNQKTSSLEMIVMNAIIFKRFGISDKYYMSRLARQNRTKSDAEFAVEMKSRKTSYEVDSDDDDV